LDGLRELILLNKSLEAHGSNSQYLTENADQLRQRAIDRMRSSAATDKGQTEANAGTLTAAMERLATALEQQSNAVC
jgi:response regulator of citrate/malate metabolism